MRKGPNHRRGAGCWDLHPLLPQVLSGLTTDHDCNHLSLPMTPPPQTAFLLDRDSDSPQYFPFLAQGKYLTV